MEVPSIEDFLTLKAEVAALKKQISQLSVERNMAEWVSVEVAEKMINCSRTTIWRLVKGKKLAIEKNGRKVRIGVNSIRQHLINCRYEPATAQTIINKYFHV